MKMYIVICGWMKTEFWLEDQIPWLVGIYKTEEEAVEAIRVKDKESQCIEDEDRELWPEIDIDFARFESSEDEFNCIEARSEETGLCYRVESIDLTD